MPDSPALDEGPDPYDGQDLEGLLSGADCHVPEGLRPVVPTLEALRAAPMPAELAGEAAARAGFRQLVVAGEGEPAWPASGTGSRTLVAAPGGSGGGPHQLPGRHRRPRPAQRGHWQVRALAGVAAVAVIAVGAAAMAGTFSGHGVHPAPAGSSSGATTAGSATARPPGAGSKGVEGAGTQAPTVKPTPETSTRQAGGTGANPSELCREYYASFVPGQRLSESQQYKLGQQLSDLAGGAEKVYPYCMHLLQPWAAGATGPGSNPSMPFRGFPPSGNQPGSGGSQGAKGADWPPGDGGDGGGPAGNSRSGGGPGHGGQGQR